MNESVIEWLNSPSGEMWSLRQYYSRMHEGNFHGSGIFGEVKYQVSMHGDAEETCECSEAMRWYPRGSQDVRPYP